MSSLQPVHPKDNELQAPLIQLSEHLLANKTGEGSRLPQVSCSGPGAGYRQARICPQGLYNWFPLWPNLEAPCSAQGWHGVPEERLFFP